MAMPFPDLYSSVKKRIKEPEILYKFNKLKREEFSILWIFCCDYLNDELARLRDMNKPEEKYDFILNSDKRLEHTFTQKFPGNSFSYYYDLLIKFMDIYKK